MSTRFIDRYLAFCVALAVGFVVIVLFATTGQRHTHSYKVSSTQGQTYA